MQAKPRRWSVELGSLFAASICWANSAQAEAPRTAVVSPGRIVRLGNVLSIGTAASGVVADLQVRDGMRVEKGQLLLRIECMDLEKELEKGEARGGRSGPGACAARAPSLKQGAVVTAENLPGAQLDAVTQSIGGTAAPGHERGVREVTLAYTNSSLNWPVGLRVTVKFKACPAD